MYYLVKWCSLPYEDSTWELKDDVDQSKIEEFEQLRAVKPDSRRVVSHAYRHSSLITSLIYKLFAFGAVSANKTVPRFFLFCLFCVMVQICCSGIVGENVLTLHPPNILYGKINWHH